MKILRMVNKNAVAAASLQQALRKNGDKEQFFQWYWQARSGLIKQGL